MFGAQLVSATIVVRDEGGHEYVVDIPHLTGYFHIREVADYDYFPVPGVPGAQIIGAVHTRFLPEMEDAEVMPDTDGTKFTVVPVREETND